MEKNIAPLAPLFSDIHDALKFITRKERLPQPVIMEATLAAVREIERYRREHRHAR